MDKISVFISEEALETRIQEMADKINRDYAGKTVHLIGILKGSVFFVCELAKRLTIPATLDFMSVSSYGSEPESIRLITLLNKPDRREKEVEVDDSGFVIPDVFVVGYGLDYAQKYRNLPYIGVVEV